MVYQKVTELPLARSGRTAAMPREAVHVDIFGMSLIGPVGTAFGQEELCRGVHADCRYGGHKGQRAADAAVLRAAGKEGDEGDVSVAWPVCSRLTMFAVLVLMTESTVTVSAVSCFVGKQITQGRPGLP
jgi:hypothetical protein